MRLVNAVTLELEDFSNKPVPQYAILSHTWGDGEVTLQDMQDAQMASQKAGYAKIKKCCELARVRGLKYAWVDTCCIDKSSSAELSEAINSMFKWYEDSHDCYAYLADVEPEATSAVASFKKSRWFTRGWTLQELLAPTKLHFYASDWTYIATRRRISKQLSLITKIDESFLDRPDNQGIDKMLGAASIAERMSWASNRQTTREEDIAYCLLGLFGINMPLLYGEGKRAFRRLQEEIVRRSDDQSLFAWMYTAEHHGPDGFPGFLAASPSNFAESSHIVPCRAGSRRSVFSISNKGLQISLPMLEEHALLECHPSDDPSTLIVVRLRHFHGDTYGRAVDEKQAGPSASSQKGSTSYAYRGCR
ncbi:HET-domain-containing protein [Pleurostoma richardsiae]|uniref:HET-domain-containing protein n=1 Tax=Pleurostoma richardsiae TaxID=41990 RepID=A0AA38RUL4_9PEZI|nr:HET-domain-containing protein [Pleurostoma richardsiae]